MEEIQKEVQEPKENLEEEQELLKEPEPDAIKQSVIDQFGLDEDADSELIEKLVADKVESGKRLSTAIKQKRNWRDKANAPKEQKKEDIPQPQEKKPVFDESIIDKKVLEKLEERELESLEISDELKQEVKTYAKAAGLTVKQVLKSDYYQFLKQKDEAKQKIDEASIGGKKRGAPSGKDFSSVKPSDFDLSTKEGRDGWDEYKKWLKKQG